MGEIEISCPQINYTITGIYLYNSCQKVTQKGIKPTTSVCTDHFLRSCVPGLS